MNRQKVEHIGDCDVCPRVSVRITYGWTTRKKHCDQCDLQRRRKAQKAKGQVLWANEKRKRQEALKLAKPTVRKSRMVAPPTKAHRDDLAEDERVSKEIWRDRKHQCFECGEELHGKPEKGYFSHVKSKGARPDLRHVKDNIVLHCHPGGCHEMWEAGLREYMPRTRELYDNLCVDFPDNKFKR